MSHRRAPPRSRSITRSPSPKISFSTPTHHHPHLPPALRQRKSHPEPPQLAQVDEADDVVAPAVVPAPISTTVSTAVKDDKGKKVDWEIPRKTLHSSIGFLTLWLYSTGGSPEPVIRALALALCVIVPADVLRLNWPAFARVYETFLGFLMRESEKRKSNGVIWYIVGVLWVLTLYPVDIAVISILLLSWADTAASTFGRLWGRHTPPLPRHLLFLPLAPRKSLAGFLAAFITGASVVAGFYALASPPNASWSFIDGAREAGYDATVVGLAVRAWLRENVDGWTGVGSTGGWVGAGVLAVGAGVVTAVAEALDLGELDDNLTLPIIAGGATWALVRVMSWFA